MVREAAARHADGWNGWGISLADFAAMAADVRAQSDGRTEVTWGGQVLVGRNPAEAAAKLERHGPRPGLVNGTVDDLREFLLALREAGASWAVCSPLDVGVDDEAVDLLAAARP
jgi:alkanesulfonate monooxygenase SsuD/methylene tetrahydromethanopterin reductase-like flavin-dependent oxidoreductase (luciferase family)